MIHATFVMEQHLGHQTYYQNLRGFVETAPHVHASWIPVTYNEPNGLLERISVLPRHLRGTLRGREQVLRGIERAGGDVLFFNTQVPAVLGGGLTRRRPYLVATDLTPLQYDQFSEQYNHRPDRGGPLASYKHRANTAVFRGAARLLPWSSWARDSLVADYGVAPDRIEVVPPGVDLSRWHPGHSGEQGPLRILFVGGDLERKGGVVLLRAFQALPRGATELHLVTRSKAPHVDGVRVYHNMQPNSPELIALFHQCDVFVLPTEAEAFGIAAIEACAAQLPVIATAVGGLTDIVADGESGFLIQPGDVQALTARLLHLANDPALRRRMGRAARLRAETLFDARRNAGRVVACMEEVVEAALQNSSAIGANR